MSESLYIYDQEVPEDYEECPICGIDHKYFPSEAKAAHEKLDRESNNNSVCIDLFGCEE